MNLCTMYQKVVCVLFVAGFSLVTSSSKGDTRGRRKKYVIEVQDHQSAMKAANPVVDLEDTVRRGINDPLTDPRFFMNRVNLNYFHSPLTDNSLRNNELLAYQGKDKLSSPVLHLGSPASAHQLTSGMPFQQNSAKAAVITKRPDSIPAFQDIGLPGQPFAVHQNQELPSSNIASLLSGNMHSTGGLHPQKPVDERASSFSRISSRPNKFINNPGPQKGVNPITGLPEDLEDSTYGAVSSITSVSDPQPMPSSVVVDTSEASQNTDMGDKQGLHRDLASQRQEETTQGSSTSDLTSIESLHSDKRIPEDNFSSLKAFLEADNDLRDRLSKDGIEGLDLPTAKKHFANMKRTMVGRNKHQHWIKKFKRPSR